MLSSSCCANPFKTEFWFIGLGCLFFRQKTLYAKTDHTNYLNAAFPIKFEFAARGLWEVVSFFTPNFLNQELLPMLALNIVIPNALYRSNLYELLENKHRHVSSIFCEWLYFFGFYRTRNFKVLLRILKLKRRNEA